MPMSTKCQKNEEKMTMPFNMMIGYDRFTIEHFPLRQRVTLPTKSLVYILDVIVF
jgi:hypothetical protein